MYAIRTLRRLRSDKRGATAIEYVLIVSLICIAVIGGMEALGGGSNGMEAGLGTRRYSSLRYSSPRHVRVPTPIAAPLRHGHMAHGRACERAAR